MAKKAPFNPTWIWRVLDKLDSRRGPVALLVAVLTGLAVYLIDVGIQEVSHDPRNPALMTNGWFRGSIVIIVLMAIIGGMALAAIFLPNRRDRVDGYLRQTAADIANRVDAWVTDQVRDDPVRLAKAQGRPPTGEERHRHNQIHYQVMAEFRKRFPAELLELNQELQREQVNRSFGRGLFSVGEIRGLARELRAFSETRGPIIRG